MLDEYKKKFLAWLMFIGQIINGAVWFLNNLPSTSSPLGLFSDQQPKNATWHLVFAFGLHLAQSFLPRLQKTKS